MKTKLNLTNVRMVLKKVLFNPNKGAFKIICDHDDHEYYVRRAIDLLKESFGSPSNIKIVKYESAIRHIVIAVIKYAIQTENRK